MKKSLIPLFRKTSSILGKRYSNHRFDKRIQPKQSWATSCQCLCTNPHRQIIPAQVHEDMENELHTSSETSRHKKKAKRAYKKQLLDGAGSILKDPGVLNPQKMQQSDLIDHLKKSADLQDDIIVLNKPPGLPISGSPKSDNEVSLVSLLPELADAIGHPSAEIVTGADREMSGLLLLGHDKTCAGELSKALLVTKKSRKLSRRYWAVTIGIPSQEQGVIEETIGYEMIGDQLLAVIRHDPSKGSFRRKKAPSWKPSNKKETNKKAETHYHVICRNEELNCALVEIKTHSVCKHQLQVHLMHRLHPVLGDHIYSSRIGKVLGVQVQLDPHEALPDTQDVGHQLKKALLLRRGLLHMLPLHLHWYDVTLPNWKSSKDVCIRVPPPDYFWKTLQLLNLSPPLLQDS